MHEDVAELRRIVGVEILDDEARPTGRRCPVNRWVDPLPDLVWARLAFARSDASFPQFAAEANADDLAESARVVAVP